MNKKSFKRYDNVPLVLQILRRHEFAVRLLVGIIGVTCIVLTQLVTYGGLFQVIMLSVGISLVASSFITLIEVGMGNNAHEFIRFVAREIDDKIDALLENSRLEELLESGIRAIYISEMLKFVTQYHLLYHI